MKSKLLGISVSSFGGRAPLLRLLLLAIIVTSESSRPAFACSAVASTSEAHPLVGANYDWKARGAIVFESPRGQHKQAVRFNHVGATAAWTSRYASLTVSQFGRDFPMQGLNEKGLMGLVLVAPADYPKQGPLGVISEISWLQFQLDQYASVDDVAAHASDFGIEKVSADLHWFLCDARHACIIVEFEHGKPVVHRLSPDSIRAVTNSSYHSAQEAYSRWQSSGSTAPNGYQSLNRYIRLASRGPLAHEWQLIEAIDDVALRGFTAFQTLFDLEAKEMRVRLANGVWRPLSLTDRRLDCGSDHEMFDLGAGRWTAYDFDAVDLLFSKATDGAEDLTPERRQKILALTSVINCDDSKDQQQREEP